MYKNLHFKIILILVIFTVTLMSVIGAVLVGSAFSFYSDDFFSQMETAFDEDSTLTAELLAAFADEDFAVRQSETLRAYSGVLGIDKYRDFYVLDGNGDYRYGSDSSDGEDLEKTPNLIAAMSGKSGTKRWLWTSYIDYALYLESGERQTIVYVKDTQEDVRSLSAMIFRITIQAMFFGMLVAIILSFFLAKAIASPIRNLTEDAKRIADGDFSEEVRAESDDEIGALSETFKYMKSALKNSLDEISGERQKFETLFLYLNDAVLTFDSFGGLMHINKMAKRLFHFDTPESEKRLNFFNFSQMVKLLKIDYREIAEEYKTKGDYSLQDVIYEEKALDVMLADFRYMEDNAESRGIMCVIHDVTEHYSLDRSRRAFVADVSHELRTPLTSIKGAAETLKEHPDLDAETRDYLLAIAIEECDRLTRLTSSLLVLSRLDNQRTQWKVETFLVSDFMKRLYEITNAEARERGHTMNFRCADGIPEVTGDREKLQQVLINIISNSVKYTKNGGKIEVAAEPEETGVLIRVTDNGMGIPEEDLPHLFERFYRVEKARSSDAGGTGLGLAIAKEILDAHGGTVQVESKVGRGTTTVVRLPYVCKLTDNS